MMKLVFLSFSLLSIFSISGCGESDLTYKNNDKGSSIIIIAHRGASGYVPEHTLSAYAMAHAMKADYIEPDLVLSKDGVLMAFHDLTLEGITNVEEVFSSRRREDGSWYVIDFTVKELKELDLYGRHEGRYGSDVSGFKPATFEEVLALLSELNRIAGGNVGIYPEIKSSAFHSDAGFDIVKKVVSKLLDYGYSGREDRVYLQSFEPRDLRRARFELGSKIKIIQLISNNVQYDKMVTPKGLDEIAEYADGIGVSKSRLKRSTDIRDMTNGRDLKLHAYTLRADGVSRAYDSFEEELSAFINVHKVDGVFTDHPDVVYSLSN